jgi:hypothetical protein
MECVCRTVHNKSFSRIKFDLSLGSIIKLTYYFTTQNINQKPVLPPKKTTRSTVQICLLIFPWTLNVKCWTTAVHNCVKLGAFAVTIVNLTPLRSYDRFLMAVNSLV